MDHSTITTHEHGVVRIFLHDRPADMELGAPLPLADIAASLGVADLNEADVQQIWTTQTDGAPFASFLRSAYDANEDDISAQKDAITAMDEVKGLIVLIRSSAFTSRPATIRLEGLLNHVASVREPDASVTVEPLPNPGAAPVEPEIPPKKTPSDAAMGGRVATIALLVMALLVWLMIWIAG